MRAVIQRVTKSTVSVAGKLIGKIDKGLLILLAVHKNDTDQSVEKLALKIIKLRIFSDQNDKMNLSICDIGGEILVISQFTLYANTVKGNRPSFTDSAEHEIAKKYYEQFVTLLRNYRLKVYTGKFGAMMEVKLINDGPVTLIVDV